MTTQTKDPIELIKKAEQESQKKIDQARHDNEVSLRNLQDSLESELEEFTSELKSSNESKLQSDREEAAKIAESKLAEARKEADSLVQSGKKNLQSAVAVIEKSFKESIKK